MKCSGLVYFNLMLLLNLGKETGVLHSYHKLFGEIGLKMFFLEIYRVVTKTLACLISWLVGLCGTEATITKC